MFILSTNYKQQFPLKRKPIVSHTLLLALSLAKDEAQDDPYSCLVGAGLSDPSPEKPAFSNQVEEEAPRSASQGASDSQTPSPNPPKLPDPSDCRAPMKQESSPGPVAGELRLSETAVYHRMRRVFHPTGGKKRKVSDEMVKQWDKGGKSRRSLQQIFQSCGYNPD